MKKMVKYAFAFALVVGCVILIQKERSRSVAGRMSKLTLANIEAMAVLPMEGEGTRIPCSQQIREYCYFRVWDASGKYITGRVWKDYVFTPID